ncbi:MAG: hypothetical protein IKL31_00585 [Ruminococcus sp.]|nr:hypothetical protein [Ruminococcus sp.]
MAAYIDIYKNSKYCGYTDISEINEYLSEYETNAAQMLEDLDWDEVVLYAIYSYDNDSSLISADFMLLRLSYPQYVKLASKISKNCRLFFKSNM